MVTVKELFDLSHSAAAPLLGRFEYPWEALSDISDFIIEIGKKLPEDEFDHPQEDVWIAKDATVFPSAYVHGPCIIGHRTEVRHCAFIRGSALVGNDCVVANSTELKNVILFDGVQVPHYNYVGDSILGYKAHMGAGSITSNVKGDKTNVGVKTREGNIEKKKKKFGAMLGDFAEIGCNSVLNPGTVIGRNSQIYPVSCVRGVVPPDSIYKDKDDIVIKRK